MAVWSNSTARLCKAALLSGAAFCLATGASAQDGRGSLGFYGMPGILDTPTARSMDDADIALSFAYVGPQRRGTLAFQVFPRLTGSFRYSATDDLIVQGETLYDRSLDLHFRFLDETDWRPAMAIGLRDLGGTGVFASEYIVASKGFGDRLDISAGIGWGRLATRDAFDNPFGLDDRPDFSGLGGEPGFDQWFRGPAAFFGGIEYRATDQLTLKAEYSSDAYTREEGVGILDVESPFNFGVEYEWRPGTVLGAHYMFGSEIGLSASLILNPKNPPTGDRSPAPIPVAVRPGNASDWDGAWSEVPARRDAFAVAMVTVLEADGMGLEYLDLDARTARLGLRNDKYDVETQAIGRVARIMSAVMPPSVEIFVIEPVVNGVAASSVTIRRSDLERLEHVPDNTRQIMPRIGIGEAGPNPGPDARPDDLYPALTWGLGPYVAASAFDPDSPLRADAGIEATAKLDLAPGLSTSGAVRLKLIGNQDESDRVSDSVLPRVRSDANIYAREGESGLEYWTVDYLMRPGEDLYARVSAGYLEKMYGGISGELLWKPVDSRLGLGVEVNYVQQRDFDKLFGFQDYSIATGHVSAYYDLGGGFDAQVDVGRYLAGDWGATFGLDRTFANGWSLGAFATFTDVSAEEFGEGSFDKGIRFSAPLSWFTGQPSRTELSSTIRPVLRDGGARLNVRNRLFPLVEDYHEGELEDGAGKFWR